MKECIWWDKNMPFLIFKDVQCSRQTKQKSEQKSHQAVRETDIKVINHHTHL